MVEEDMVEEVVGHQARIIHQEVGLVHMVVIIEEGIHQEIGQVHLHHQVEVGQEDMDDIMEDIMEDMDVGLVQVVILDHMLVDIMENGMKY